MAVIVLAGGEISDEEDVHRVLRRELDLGAYYGGNLAALRDRLSADVSRPLRIVWRDAATSRAAMGETTYSKIVAVFHEVEEQDLAFRLDERFEFVAE